MGQTVVVGKPRSNQVRYSIRGEADSSVINLVGLFIGSMVTEQNFTGLQRKGITHVLQTADVLQPTHGTLLKYLSIPVNDDEREDLVAWFPKAFEFIDEGIQKGGVLVHCAAGVSRSATFLLGWLMTRRNMRLKDAMKKLQAARPEVAPNPGFRAQLEEFEKLGCDQSKWTPWSQKWSGGSSIINSRPFGWLRSL